MTDYEWLEGMGLCHRCRKEKVAPKRKYCFDCLDKIQQENALRYDPEYAKAYQKRRKEIYQEKKQKGICIRCNKKATQGMYCIDCFLKAKRNGAKTSARRKAERYSRGNAVENRKVAGMCTRCGELLTECDKERGYVTCAVCREKLRQYGEIGRKNHAWRKDESLRYIKNKRWKNGSADERIQNAR